MKAFWIDFSAEFFFFHASVIVILFISQSKSIFMSSKKSD